MTLQYADRVLETTTTTGTGTYSLAGATAGYRTFVAGIGTGNICSYCCEDGTNWEVGIGTVTDATPDTLSRDVIIGSSNADAAVDWGAGSKNVFCQLDARHARPLGGPAAIPGSTQGWRRTQQHITHGFSVATGWTVSGCTVAADTTYAVTSGIESGSLVLQSLQVTKTTTVSTTAEVTKAWSPGVDLTAKTFCIRVYIETPANINTIRLYLAHGAWAHYRYWNFSVATITSRAGWVELWGDMGFGYTESGTFDPASVDTIRIRLDTTNVTDLPVFTVDSVTFYDHPTKGVVAFTVDDSLSAQKIGYGYAAALGIPVTIYTKVGYIGTANYLTWADCHELQAAGHLIGNHSYSHTYYDAATAKELQMNDYLRAKQVLIEHGFAAGASIFALPGGTPEAVEPTTFWDVSDREAWGLFDSLRLTTASGQLTGPLGGRLWGTQQFVELASAGDVTTFQGLVDNAATGTIQVFGTHFTSATAANIKTALDYVKAAVDAGTIIAVTMADLATMRFDEI